MARRILWLSNDTWQRNFEVRWLIENGYEVYCPKKCGYGLGDSSQSVTFEYDRSLSLTDAVLEKLNQADLYNDLNDGLFEIMNQYFDIVMTRPITKCLRSLLHHYKGVLILRWVGDEDGLTCTERLIREGGYNLLYQLNRIKYRFYFAYSFKHEIADECDLFRGRGINLPLPILETTGKEEDNKDIFLLCPNICLDPEVNEKFRRYQYLIKYDFKVFGDQLVKPGHNQDLFIGNNVEEQQKCMEKCSLAIDVGSKSTLLTEPWIRMLNKNIPLLYTVESKAVDLLGKKAAGFCKNENDVLRKLKKLVSGDKILRDRILGHQIEVLSDLGIQQCHKKWIEAFRFIHQNLAEGMQYNRKKKICVILPVFYLGGFFSYTVRFVTSLYDEVVRNNADVEIVFAHVKNEEYDMRDSFFSIRKRGVQIREITPQVIEKEHAKRMLEMAGMLPKKWHGEERIPSGTMYDDGVHMLMDCDYLIDTTDRSGSDAPIMEMYPYAVVAHDYIQRYSPLQGDPVFIPTNRKADHVFVTSEPTYTDSIQYAMVKQENLSLLPILFEMMGKKEEFGIRDKENYFLWSTNCSKHKNHLKALLALDLYYKNGGNLECRITGFLSNCLNPKKSMKKYRSDDELCAYVAPIRKFIREHKKLREHLVFEDYVDDEQFRKLIKGARFTFHPGFADNGNGTALDAATFGVPTLSNDYPAMRYLSDYAKIHCKFVALQKTEDAADALLWMQDHAELQASLLDYDAIESHSLKSVQNEMFTEISRAIGFETEVQS